MKKRKLTEKTYLYSISVTPAAFAMTGKDTRFLQVNSYEVIFRPVKVTPLLPYKQNRTWFSLTSFLKIHDYRCSNKLL